MTAEYALALAAKYGLQDEVQYCLDHGDSPETALREWDLLGEECE